MNTINVEIDLDEVAVLVDAGGGFVLDPKAELAILRLLEMQDLVENALEAIKDKIRKEGTALGEGFRGVHGEKISAICRQYGAKYGYEKEFEEELREFLQEKTTLSVDSSAVERFVKEKGELPRGIFENDRENAISIVKRKERQL